MRYLFLILLLNCLEATPSTVFWTVCTTNVYAAGTGHIDADNYFTVFNQRGHGASLSPDIGFELGFLNWKDLSAEAGCDYSGGADDPLYFNIGAAIGEDKLFAQAPSFKVGFFNAGTRYRGHNRTAQNIVDIILGKSFLGGQLCVGGFSGSRAIGKNRQGFMVSYVHKFCSETYCDGTNYFKWVLCADYASGKNIIGGGGIGIYYYFNPDISILSGPVWFNSEKYNGKWKWSIQIDISFSVFDPKGCNS